MRLIDADKFEEYLKNLHDKYTEEIEECKKEGRTSGASYLNTHKELLINIMLRLKQQPTVNGWIPCSERLPEHLYDDCIITNIYGNVYGESRYDAKDECWKVVNRYVSAEEVVAWIPYPEPYKGDEDK